jgi:phosphatidylinositol glycan class B
MCISLLADRWYYGFWTFPAARFLHFNIAQGLAMFYGRNRWDYYVTEGLPLLLMTVLPFSVIGVYQHVATDTTQAHLKRESRIGRHVSLAIIFVVLCLSLISHKEVRFIYPLLPALFVVAAAPLHRILGNGNNTGNKTSATTIKKIAILGAVLLLNGFIIYYTTQVHQRGVIDVTHFLRSSHEERLKLDGDDARSSVAFLMPCHSTPFRSHLMHSGISAWALTCNPPVDMAQAERASYLDEADEFYADPTGWMTRAMEPVVGDGESCRPGGRAKGSKGSKAPWPDQVVFFEHLEPTMKRYLNGSDYRECWRGFNTHWHDDHRRKGDVIVFCKN